MIVGKCENSVNISMKNEKIPSVLLFISQCVGIKDRQLGDNYNITQRMELSPSGSDEKHGGHHW